MVTIRKATKPDSMGHMRRASRRQGTGNLGKYFFLFVIPAALVYIIFSIVPFLSTIYYSFTDYTDVNPINLSFVGLQNYSKVLHTPLMLKAIKNSLIYAVIITSMQIICGIPLAAVLNKQLKTRNILRAVFFFPAVFSPLIIGYLWGYIFSSSDYGLINNILHQLGFGTVKFFTAERALYSVLFTQVWQWTGWAMVIFLANLQGVPPELYEAAAVDGASGLKRFFRITLPLMAPSVKIVAITGLVGGMKVCDIIYAMTSGGPGDATQTVMTVMMKRGISDGFYSTGAAFGVLFFIVVMLVSAVATKLLGKWSEAIE